MHYAQLPQSMCFIMFVYRETIVVMTKDHISLFGILARIFYLGTRNTSLQYFLFFKNTEHLIIVRAWLTCVAV